MKKLIFTAIAISLISLTSCEVEQTETTKLKSGFTLNVESQSFREFEKNVESNNNRNVGDWTIQEGKSVTLTWNPQDSTLTESKLNESGNTVVEIHEDCRTINNRVLYMVEYIDSNAVVYNYEEETDFSDNKKVLQTTTSNPTPDNDGWIKKTQVEYLIKN